MADNLVDVRSNLHDRLTAVRALVFDVDGVLTDGGLTFASNGEEYKRFHVRDGLGIKLLQNSGIEVAVITGRKSSIVVNRCEELGIRHVYQGVGNKLETQLHLASELSLEAMQFAFMGDDLIDLPVMQNVGVALTVADADPIVQNAADWVSRYNGGQGAAREACELIMRAQGTLAPAIEHYTGQSK